MPQARAIASDALLILAKAAEFLGVSIETLAQWRSQSRGPRFIRLESRLVRYRRSDLENYLAAHSVEPSPRKRRES